MTDEPSSTSAEDRLIAHYFRPLAKHPGALGLIDDVALLTPRAGHDIVLTTDAIVGSVHFFPDDPPDMVAKKALRVNLSDLAAKGAMPAGFLLALALPTAVGDYWIERFAHGLGTDADAYAEVLDAAIGQTDVVLGRFTALLRIAEIESGGRRASFGTIALDAVLRDVAELYEPLAEHRGLSLTLETPMPVEVPGDFDLLFGAIENLLDNVLKFTPSGGRVALGVSLDGNCPVLHVADTGPGIDLAERKAVLRP